MRDPGLEQAIQTAGGVRALARALGVSQPAVSMWKRIPAERVADIEAVTGIPRAKLRPDLFSMNRMADPDLDPVDQARAQEYGLLGLLLWRAPDADVLKKLSRLRGDATPIGMAHLDLSLAAAAANPDEVQREFFDLFIGLGRGELLPYASFYLTGFLHEKPLARVREDFIRLGIAREQRVSEPEDHIAVLCEVMSGLIRGDFAGEGETPYSDAQFFDRHMSRWAARFFADLETANAARFYRKVGALGRIFIEIEAEAFALPA
jgi:TorA maturation chaperone TorD